MKLVIVGDAFTGKTSIVNALLKFPQVAYTPTLGVNVEQVTIDDTVINIWDTAGTEKYAGLGTGYFIDADAALIVFDILNKDSYKNVAEYRRKLIHVCGNIPIVVVANKTDNKMPIVKPNMIRGPHFRVSTKPGHEDTLFPPIRSLLATLIKTQSVVN